MLPNLDNATLKALHDPWPVFARTLDHFLRVAAGEGLVLRVPTHTGRPLLDEHIAHGVHHDPELFLQVQGATDFATPGERFRLMPGQIGLIPPLVAHGERTRRRAGLPFVNVVMMIERESLHLHIGQARQDRVPISTHTRAYTGRRLDAIRRYLLDAARARQDDTPGAAGRWRGSLQAALGHIRDSIDMQVSPGEHPKVARSRHIAHAHLSDPELNVRRIAERIGCSADYLSNLFHQETGVRLSAWLNEQRLARVRQLLQDTSLNISEIAWATGYRDPSYLSRCFRRVHGQTPCDYRKQRACPSSPDGRS